jgi:hypothetical protein
MDHMNHGAIHGMLIIGDDVIYLSHLPTFEPPHDYQALLRTRLSKPGGDPVSDYLADRKRTGSPVYTFRPDLPFLMPDLVSTDPATPPLRTFQGTVFRGNFFKGEGVVVTADVCVDVEAVVHFRQYTPSAEDDRLEYLLFGADGFRFAARYIKKPPDFDQMLSVDGVEPNLWCDSDTALRVAIPDRIRSAEDRLHGGEQVAVEPGSPPSGESTAGYRPTLRLSEEFYFEDGFLRGS